MRAFPQERARRRASSQPPEGRLGQGKEKAAGQVAQSPSQAGGPRGCPSSRPEMIKLVRFQYLLLCPRPPTCSSLGAPQEALP